MDKLLKKICLFLAPFFIYALTILLVDPFNYFDIFHVVENKIKRNNAFYYNNTLYKLIEYDQNLGENILLGDSRIGNIDVTKIAKLTNEKYYNFAYNAASIEEMVQTFWYLVENNTLENVYIGINLNNYNENLKRNNFDKSLSLYKNAILYIFDRATMTASYKCLYAHFFDKERIIGRPNLTKEEFWKYQIDINAKEKYTNFIYAKDYYLSLLEISKYCKKNNISLSFIISPTHVDLQSVAIECGLEKELVMFKNDLKKLGTVYDFDFDNEYTQDMNNFKDPFHFANDDLIINNIWGDESLYCIKTYRDS